MSLVKDGESVLYTGSSEFTISKSDAPPPPIPSLPKIDQQGLSPSKKVIGRLHISFFISLSAANDFDSLFDLELLDSVTHFFFFLIFFSH